MADAVHYALGADDFGILEDLGAVGRHRRNHHRLPGRDLEGFAVQRHTLPAAQADDDLLMGVGMHLRAFAGLVFEDADLEVIAGDELAEGGGVLRRDQFVLDVAEVQYRHVASSLERPLLFTSRS